MAQRSHWFLIGLVLSLLVIGATGTVFQGPDRPDALIISINSLRADHVSCYGYERNTTPNICRIADDGIRYEQAIAAHGWTTPSSASLLTGLYPGAHGIHMRPNQSILGDIPASVTTLPETLRKRGYTTHAFVKYGQHVIPSGHGFHQGFDTVQQTPTIHSALPILFQENDTSPSFTYLYAHDLHQPFRFQEQIVQEQYNNTTGPYLGWYNGTFAQFEAYPRYPPVLANTSRTDGQLAYDNGTTTIPLNETDIQYFQDRYDTTLKQIDYDIGRLLEHLRQENRYDDTLIVVTAPHGEALAEPRTGRFGHGDPIPPIIQIPLIIKPPGQTAPTTVPGQVETVDIYPTVLSFLNIPVPDNVQGQVRREPGDGAQYAHSGLERVQDKEWAYYGTPTSYGYGLVPRNNTSLNDPPDAVASRFTEHLKAWRGQNRLIYGQFHSD